MFRRAANLSPKSIYRYSKFIPTTLALCHSCCHCRAKQLEKYNFHFIFPKMKVIYNTLFKRTSTFAVAIIASAFFFERAIDVSSNMMFDSINKGVSIIM